MQPAMRFLTPGRLCRIVTLGLLLAWTSPVPVRADATQEYCERVSKLPPRSAEAHVELARWCQSVGLQKAVEACYLQAIAIDPDCAEAREALGYRRYGVEWLKPGESPRRPIPVESLPRIEAEAPGPRASTETAPSEKPPAVDAEPSTESSPGVKVVAELVSPAPIVEAPPPFRVEEPTAEAGTIGTAGNDPVRAALEAKRRWAAEAEAKFHVTFHTEETGDFLIHTTLAPSSRELKVFTKHLDDLRDMLGRTLGARSRDPIWPAKLQFVLVRSAPEFERFAEVVDGIPGARSPEGAYTNDGHTVVLTPDSPHLARVLGESALESFGGSNRHVGWWLREGLAEWLVAKTTLTTDGRVYRDGMLRAADEISQDPQGLKIFSLIDADESRRRNLQRDRALALSWVDFLIAYRSRAFQEFIAKLKSDEAPMPPETEAEFSYFLTSFVSFQEQALQDAYRAKVESLDEKWKKYTLAVAERLKKQQAAAAAPDPNDRRRRQP